MSEPQATEPPLIRNFRALARAAGEGPLRPEAAEYLAVTADQVAHLLESRAAGDPAAFPEPREGPVAGLDDLQDRISRLIATASGAGTDPAVSEYLRTVLLRLTLIQQRGEGESRLVPRFAEDRPGRLVREDGQELAVRVVDRSALGFGAVSAEAVPAGEAVRLVIPDGEAPRGEAVEEAYDCLAIFCREEAEGFRIGLDVVGEAD